MAIFDLLSLAISVLIWIMIAQFVLSLLVMFNVVSLHTPAVGGLWRALDNLLEPIYRPVRNFVPPVGGMDFSPMVVIILLQLLRKTLSILAVASIS